MNRILFIVFFLFSLTGFAQNPVIINQPYDFQKWIRVKDTAKVDGLLLPPYGDTTGKRPSRNGAIMMHTDGIYYKWNNGVGWNALGGGAAPAGSFIVGNTTPDNSIGDNGNYYLQQNKSWLFKKSAGSWGNPFAYLQSDTLVPMTPRDTELLRINVINFPAAWDPRTYIWGDGFARNRNAVGNGNLSFKDNMVRNWGYNINPNGTRKNPLESANFESWESNFDTRQFGDSAFEHHIIHLFTPGSPATAWSDGLRVWSSAQSKSDFWSDWYWQVSQMFWRWKKTPTGQFYDYMTVYPDQLKLTMNISMDSIAANGGTVFRLNGIPKIETVNPSGKSLMVMNSNTGHLDTSFLVSDGTSDFVFKRLGGSGTTKFDLNGGRMYWFDGATGIASLHATGDFIISPQNGLLSSFSVETTGPNEEYSINLNKYFDTRRAKLYISSDPVYADDWNAYFRYNCTNADSVGKPVAFNFEKLRGGNMNVSQLIGTRAMEFNINNVSRFGTIISADQANNGNYIPDFIWSNTLTGGSSLVEQMRLNHAGNLLINTTTDNGAKLNVNGGASTYGTFSSTSTGTAIYGYTSGSGTAVKIDAGADTTGKGIYINYNTSQTNAGARVYPAITIFRSASVGANHGQGTSIDWEGVNYAEGGIPAAPFTRLYHQIIAKRQNMDGPDASSQFVFRTVQDSLLKDAVTIDEGNVYLNQYDGTYTGTAAYNLSIQSDKKIIVTPVNLKGSTTWDPSSVSSLSSTTTTLTITGAALGDNVTVSKLSGTYSNGEVYDAFVSATNTITIRLNNVSGGSFDITSDTFNVIVHKY